MQPLLDEVSVPGTTDQDTELAQEDTGETSTDLVAVVKVRVFFTAIAVERGCSWF